VDGKNILYYKKLPDCPEKIKDSPSNLFIVNNERRPNEKDDTMFHTVSIFSIGDAEYLCPEKFNTNATRKKYQIGDQKAEKYKKEYISAGPKKCLWSIPEAGGIYLDPEEVSNGYYFWAIQSNKEKIKKKRNDITPCFLSTGYNTDARSDALGDLSLSPRIVQLNKNNGFSVTIGKMSSKTYLTDSELD